ncbi:MAG: hypothetical protein WBL86_23045, partial [Pseudolabrys sp.]
AKSRRTFTHVSQHLAAVWPKCANQPNHSTRSLELYLDACCRDDLSRLAALRLAAMSANDPKVDNSTAKSVAIYYRKIRS